MPISAWFRSSALLAAAVLVLSFSSERADAKPIDIIFVNDLHSYMDPHYDAETKTFRGGYAKVKTIIERLKGDSKVRGNEALILNAGDSLEGHPYYFVDDGARSLGAIENLGFDATAIGNHDWLMNMKGLEDLIRRFVLDFSKPFSFLGANFAFERKEFQYVDQSIRPFQTVERGGIRFAILGLTTPSLFYEWAAEDADIKNPFKVAKHWIPELKKDHDFVIALTHLGNDADRKLIQKTAGIDLVVGAHTHTYFPEPLYAKDRRGYSVPYVQSECHGHYVGSMTVDAEPGFPLQVVPGTFVQVPIDSSVPDHPAMATFVAETRSRFENQFEANWLNEVLAESTVTLASGEKGNPTNVSQLFVSAIKGSVESDFSFDTGVFHGLTVPPGPLTRESIMMLDPRIFEFDQKKGWTIYTAKMRGLLVKAMIQASARFGFYFVSKGLDYDLVPAKKENHFLARNIRVNGKRMKNLKLYSLAMSEGLVRGTLSAIPAMKAIIKNAVDTKVTMWAAIEKELRKLKVINNETLPWPKQAQVSTPELALNTFSDESDDPAKDFTASLNQAFDEEVANLSAEVE